MPSDEAARKALAQLEKALRFAKGAEGVDPELFEQFRNSEPFLRAALSTLARIASQ